MREFNQSEFVLAPFVTLLGDYYANYWLQAIRHKESGNIVDVLLNELGELVTEPNDITDKIRLHYYVNGQHAKVIQMKISGHQCLVIKFPTIKN